MTIVAFSKATRGMLRAIVAITHNLSYDVAFSQRLAKSLLKNIVIKPDYFQTVPTIFCEILNFLVFIRPTYFTAMRTTYMVRYGQ